jgi:hypothetical protein
MAAELMTYGLETTAQWLAGNRKRGAENGYLEVRSPAPSVLHISLRVGLDGGSARRVPV